MVVAITVVCIYPRRHNSNMKKVTDKNLKFLTILFFLLSVPRCACADFTDPTNDFSIFRPGENAPAKFYGDIAVGGSLNTGNSNAYSLNTKLDLNYDKKKWINTGSFQSQIGGDRTTGLNNRNYNAQGETKYFFAPPISYWYGLVDYTLDSFNTYRTVLLSSVGYGQRVLNRQNMTLDLEVGPSYTRRRIQGNDGSVESQFGIFSSAGYNWIISNDIKFSEVFFVTKDSLNMYTQSTTALTSNLMKNLALSVSFVYKHNTTIPPESSDTLKTDTQTVLSVVYKFSS